VKYFSVKKLNLGTYKMFSFNPLTVMHYTSRADISKLQTATHKISQATLLLDRLPNQSLLVFDRIFLELLGKTCFTFVIFISSSNTRCWGNRKGKLSNLVGLYCNFLRNIILKLGKGFVPNGVSHYSRTSFNQPRIIRRPD
jgi:hypothetical protein